MRKNENNEEERAMIRPGIQKTFDRIEAARSITGILNVLDAHRYTQDGDYRALEGLGMPSVNLSREELARAQEICEKLEEVEETCPF